MVISNRTFQVKITLIKVLKDKYKCIVMTNYQLSSTIKVLEPCIRRSKVSALEGDTKGRNALNMKIMIKI